MTYICNRRTINPRMMMMMSIRTKNVTVGQEVVLRCKHYIYIIGYVKYIALLFAVVFLHFDETTLNNKWTETKV